MTLSKPQFLDGQILIAMPGMSDPRFERALVYLCAHTSDGGAMGFIVNKRAEHIEFSELLEHLNIAQHEITFAPAVHIGGPVSPERGFVLHTADYVKDNATLRVRDGIGLTATLDILKAIATGDGPRHSLLALGYAGWAPGQLESEIQANGWLHCEADEDLLFSEDNENKWARALAKLGVDAANLSNIAGRA